MTIGWKTLDLDERALIYSKDGSSRVEVGPQRIFLFRERFQLLKCHHASQNEYLVVKYKTGKEERIQGPCIRHFNPVEHEHIKAHELQSISANEALVIYTQSKETQAVTRQVVFGPTQVMLGENEWLHNFCWHGTDASNKTRMVPKQNTFVTLKVIPDQFYYNVDEVRTMDDCLLKVKLMMFYELTDVEKMLNSTDDPMADFINCLCADVIAFAAKRNYESFIESVSELNDLQNYPQLLDRCQDIGYTVTKVVFRGYFAHPKLQDMHEKMIKMRTELALKFEKEVEQQNLIDSILVGNIERMEQEQKLVMDHLIHTHSLEMDQLKHKLKLEKTSKQQYLDGLRQENKRKLDLRIAEGTIETNHFKELHKMGVDVTKLIVSHKGYPGKVTHVVAEKDAAQVHLHHNDLPSSLSGNVFQNTS